MKTLLVVEALEDGAVGYLVSASGKTQACTLAESHAQAFLEGSSMGKLSTGSTWYEQQVPGGTTWTPGLSSDKGLH